MTLLRLLIQFVLTSTSAQMYFPLKRQEIDAADSQPPEVVRALAPELRCPRSPKCSVMAIIITLSFTDIEHSALPSPLLGAALVTQSLKHYKENRITSAYTPTATAASPPTAWSSFPFLGQSLCTTPKTPEQSVSKGSLCPWVHAPEPWPVMGTVCKQHREFTFYMS